MAYTPINWQTGDTITADKLNRCDNGWGYESTQLFSETVTTEADGDVAFGELSYRGTSTPDHLTITFDGTAYQCTFIDDAYGNQDGTWADYPFSLSVDGFAHEWSLVTPTAGTYTVSASMSEVVTSAGFDTAVKSVVDADAIPLKCVSGTTTRAEMVAAESAGRLMYFTSGGYFIITGGVSGGIITFMPEQSGLNAEFDGNDLFYLYYL